MLYSWQNPIMCRYIYIYVIILYLYSYYVYRICRYPPKNINTAKYHMGQNIMTTIIRMLMTTLWFNWIQWDIIPHDLITFYHIPKKYIYIYIYKHNIYIYDGLPKCFFLVLLINRDSLRAASYCAFLTMTDLNSLKPCILSFMSEAVAKTCSKC